MTYEETIAQIAPKAEAIFEEKYAALRACFDTTRFLEILRDEVQIVGVSQEVRQNPTVETLVKSAERICWALFERKAFHKIQKFPLTKEAEAELKRMEVSVRGIPRGSVITSGTNAETPAATTPVSRWANLTYAEWQRIPSREDRSRRASDPEYAARVEELMEEEDKKNVLRPNTGGRVYLQRQDNKLWLWKFENGKALWASEADHMPSHFDHQAAHSYIQEFAKSGLVVLAFDLDGNPVNVSPREDVPVNEPVKKPLTWRIVGKDLLTVRPGHKVGISTLKAKNGEYVARIDYTTGDIVTVRHPSNAHGYTSRAAAIDAAKSVPDDMPLYLCRYDGQLVPEAELAAALRTSS